MNEATVSNVAIGLMLYVLPLLTIAFILLLVSVIRMHKRLDKQGERIALLEKVMKEK